MTTFKTSREIPATVDQVFAAFGDQERLARWWGQAGFTNNFSVFEFRNGGRWYYVLHGPDGRDFPHDSVFAEIESPGRIVIQHISEPKFLLTITIDASAVGSVVTWSLEFENPEVAGRGEQMITRVNEQNLDRLSAEVLRAQSDG